MDLRKEAKRKKSERITYDSYLYTSINWLFVEYAHVNTKLAIKISLIGKKLLAVDWTSMKTSFIQFTFPPQAQRKHNAIRVSFVPWMIDVTPLELHVE